MRRNQQQCDFETFYCTLYVYNIQKFKTNVLTIYEVSTLTTFMIESKRHRIDLIKIVDLI